MACRPHEVYTGIVVIRLLKCDRAIVDHGLEQGLCHALLHVCTIIHREVVLERVAHHVCHASCGLACRNRECIGQIEHRHCRLQALFCRAPLLVLCHVRDDGKGIHLGARSSKRKRREDRQGILDELRMDHEIPGIAVVLCAGCNDLYAVDCGAVADNEDHIDGLLAAELDTVAHGLDAWVRLDARELEDLKACIGEDFRCLIIGAVALDGASAVAQENLLAISRKICKMRDLALAEVDGRRYMEREIIHSYSLAGMVLPLVPVPLIPASKRGKAEWMPV